MIEVITMCYKCGNPLEPEILKGLIERVREWNNEYPNDTGYKQGLCYECIRICSLQYLYKEGVLKEQREAISERITIKD